MRSNVFFIAQSSEIPPDGTGVSLTFKRQKGCVARVSNLAEAPLLNGRRSAETDVWGPAEELPYVRTRARSLHFGHYSLW